MNIYVDRNNLTIAEGQRVRVRHCVGRYGQCKETDGILDSMDPYGGMRLQIAHELVYIPFTWERVDKGIFRGYHRHYDYEHGHETWVEIIG